MHRCLPLSLWSALFIVLPCLASEPSETDPSRQSSQGKLRTVQLHPRSATYTATLERGISISGQASRSLEKTDDGLWRYSFDVDSFIADVRESSVFRYKDQRVISDRYRYSLEGFLIGNRYRSYDFDWDREIIKDREHDRELDISDTPEIQDQLGAQLQLWVDLKAGMKHMEYIVPGKDPGDGFKDYEFAVLREETLETERFGKLETVLVERVRDADSPRTTHLWFVPDWNYLLVRLDQINTEGENFRILLRKATLHDQTIQP